MSYVRNRIFTSQLQTGEYFLVLDQVVSLITSYRLRQSNRFSTIDKEGTLAFHLQYNCAPSKFAPYAASSTSLKRYRQSLCRLQSVSEAKHTPGYSCRCRCHSRRPQVIMSSDVDTAAIRQAAKNAGQDHVFQQWDSLNESQQKSLIRDVKVRVPLCCMLESSLHILHRTVSITSTWLRCDVIAQPSSPCDR